MQRAGVIPCTLAPHTMKPPKKRLSKRALTLWFAVNLFKNKTTGLATFRMWRCSARNRWVFGRWSRNVWTSRHFPTHLSRAAAAGQRRSNTGRRRGEAVPSFVPLGKQLSLPRLRRWSQRKSEKKNIAARWRKKKRKVLPSVRARRAAECAPGLLFGVRPLW